VIGVLVTLRTPPTLPTHGASLPTHACAGSPSPRADGRCRRSCDAPDVYSSGQSAVTLSQAA